MRLETFLEFPFPGRAFQPLLYPRPQGERDGECTREAGLSKFNFIPTLHFHLSVTDLDDICSLGPHRTLGT